MTNSERSAVGFSRPIIMTLYQSKLVGHQMAYPRLHSFKHYANTEATRRFFPYSVPTLKTHRCAYHTQPRKTVGSRQRDSRT